MLVQNNENTDNSDVMLLVLNFHPALLGMREIVESLWTLRSP